LPELIITSDGSHTIFVPELNEHYHSIHGAVQESNIIFINSGFKFSKEDPLNIFEVGFGTGLNAFLTAVESSKGNRKINYTTIEKYPLDAALINKLNHKDFADNYGLEIYNRIQSSPWEEFTEISDTFTLKKLKGDFTTTNPGNTYDLIYFDAFGPDKQPEMWTREIFERIAVMTRRDGIFVTYSAKGEVKRNLLACGFQVTLQPGPPGKRQIIRAIKN
jgi:tRNA U34 5-methylaminomethyl-2-thiouridine-forming methyltransferase MnmC